MTFVLEFVRLLQHIRNLCEIDRNMVLNVKESHFMGLELIAICKVAKNLNKYLYNKHLSLITYR